MTTKISVCYIYIELAASCDQWHHTPSGQWKKVLESTLCLCVVNLDTLGTAVRCNLKKFFFFKKKKFCSCLGNINRATKEEYAFCSCFSAAILRGEKENKGYFTRADTVNHLRISWPKCRSLNSILNNRYADDGERERASGCQVGLDEQWVTPWNTHHAAACYIHSANMPAEQTCREHSLNNRAEPSPGRLFPTLWCCI